MNCLKTEPKKVEAAKLKLDEIVRNLKTDCKDWNKFHTAGLPLVNEMAKIYGKCLTIMKNLQKKKTARAHNIDRRRLKESKKSLKESAERLTQLVDRLLDSTEHTRQNLLALRQLCATNGELYEYIFYRNWQMRDMLEFTESIMRFYDAEYEIKEMVLEELTNSKDHQELNFIRKAWREPRHALTLEFNSMFKEFNFETADVI